MLLLLLVEKWWKEKAAWLLHLLLEVVVLVDVAYLMLLLFTAERRPTSLYRLKGLLQLLLLLSARGWLLTSSLLQLGVHIGTSFQLLGKPLLFELLALLLLDSLPSLLHLLFTHPVCLLHFGFFLASLVQLALIDFRAEVLGLHLGFG